MKAMRLHAPAPAENRPLRLEDVPVPEPGPGEVRIRVSMCGVCHTDLHTVEGDLTLPRLPIIPGHQIVGTIDALGEGVREFHPGQRVGVTWMHSGCGACEYCTRDLENLCPEARFTGLHADGGYAEFAIARAHWTYPLPDVFSDEHAAPLLCAGVIGFRSLRLSDIEPGGRLGLFGFGASAHVCIQIARHWDCEVYVFSRSAEHRRHAERLGAAWTGRAGDRPPALLDSAITFAPVGWIVHEALKTVRPGGTVAINAVHLTPIPETPYDLIYHERTLRTVANCTRRDAVEFLRAAAEIPVHTDVEVYPLEAANEVLLRVKRSEVCGAAVLRAAGADSNP